MMNKELITARFKRAASTYGENATAQKRIAGNLMRLLTYCERCLPKRVLEVGCGSGFLTRMLHDSFRPIELVANDLVSPSAHLTLEIPRSVKFMEGDAEAIEFGREFDLIASSSTIQWFRHLPSFLEKSARSLNDGGILAVSTFLPGNLGEIKELTGIGLDYPDKAELEALFSRHFNLLSIHSEEIRLHFDHPVDVLKHMRKTGVTGIGNFRWTKEKLNDFTTQYRRLFSDEKRCHLTYKPIYLIAQKKNEPYDL